MAQMCDQVECSHRFGYVNRLLVAVAVFNCSCGSSAKSSQVAPELPAVASAVDASPAAIDPALTAGKKAENDRHDCGVSEPDPFGYSRQLVEPGPVASDGSCHSCEKPPITLSPCEKSAPLFGGTRESKEKLIRRKAWLGWGYQHSYGFAVASACACKPKKHGFSHEYLTLSSSRPAKEPARQETEDGELILDTEHAVLKLSSDAHFDGLGAFRTKTGTLICDASGSASYCCPFELGRPRFGGWVVVTGRMLAEQSSPSRSTDTTNQKEEMPRTEPALVFEIDDICRLAE